MKPMTLTEFLLARIAEDEAAARACSEVFPPPWDVIDRGHSATVKADEPNFWIVSELDQEQEAPGRWPGDHLEHIARHDPARVLAECEAKRRIVEREIGAYFVDGRQVGTIASTPTLRDLALPYADHPDYDETWRP